MMGGYRLNSVKRRSLLDASSGVRIGRSDVFICQSENSEPNGV